MLSSRSCLTTFRGGFGQSTPPQPPKTSHFASVTRNPSCTCRVPASPERLDGTDPIRLRRRTEGSTRNGRQLPILVAVCPRVAKGRRARPLQPPRLRRRDGRAGGRLLVLDGRDGAVRASGVRRPPRPSSRSAASREMARASVFYDTRAGRRSRSSRNSASRCRSIRCRRTCKQAMLAIEDQRFYEHRGVDLVRIAGAAVANLRERRAAQGASTITQQLARMSFLTPEKTYTRKLQEIVLAALHRRRSTRRIRSSSSISTRSISAPASTAPRPRRSATSASTRRISTVAEAALLAGLVKAPSNYAPTANLERAVKRRAVVLQAMHEMGAIDEPTLQAGARPRKVVLDDALRKEEPYGRFFKEHVRRELVARFGEERVYEGGLKVYTTIDSTCSAPPTPKCSARSNELDNAAAARARGRPGDAAGGAGRARSAHRRSARADRRPRLHPEQLQPRDRRRSGSRARRSSRSSTRRRSRPATRRRALIDRPRRADRHAAGRVGARRRPLDGERDDDARGAEDVEQSRRGADDRRSRHPARPSTTPSASASAPCRACRRWRSAPARSRSNR